ncbi:LLM class flavin-dependent oxidoreductase [Paenibacillus thiaminolyticus]|uniref:LLM class flavin-dependent oxidoreductase n=1 Tax=Paenibacillus thiaminolyticus TaxID=49283 RepID=UPI00232B3565|nr:LLM class flavin-dependent oxidoreductase [Paenibacillus thiaminolyticus]WCF09451.1 LLM class flavin-dependent oxidoreductase [Paenibacillus thiaminolyticus]
MNIGILDQSPILPGENATDAFRHTLELAAHADRLGFSRYWVSEHHDATGLAGSSPEVLIASIAAHTKRIRVGSGGVLLPHYSPYKVAENFHVLAALYPGRIDLGIGRAPGGMPLATRALRYGRPADYENTFDRALSDLGGFLKHDLPAEHPLHGLKATPIPEQAPEVWLLGSSGYSGRKAAEMGASFSFAHFINGEGGEEVVRAYYDAFRPGPLGDKPRANACIIVICADSDEEAERLATSVDLRLLLLDRGDSRATFVSPEKAAAFPYTEWDRDRIRYNRGRMIVGGPDKVKRDLEAFAERYGIDEVIAMTVTYDFEARLRSYELLGEIFRPHRE